MLCDININPFILRLHFHSLAKYGFAFIRELSFYNKMVVITSGLQICFVDWILGIKRSKQIKSKMRERKKKVGWDVIFIY